MVSQRCVFQCAQDYGAAIERNPRFVEASEIARLFSVNQNEFDRAIIDLNQAIGTGSQSVLCVLSSRLCAKYSKGEFERSIRDF